VLLERGLRNVRWALRECAADRRYEQGCGEKGKGFADQVVKAPGAKLRSCLV
jgi:hypothetical protein